ncbi:hypothetical protein OAG82_00905 [Rubripirellula sp.]|nr:hypothetical protein [Rubripirellula sp.]MDB4621390.1 hypothetical protein [Rubripirellula sp.]
MLGPILIYPAWLCLCVAGIFRPWIAVVGFYGCVLLEPTWNWRWSIPQDFAFQKYLAASALLGFVLTGFAGNKLCKPLPRAMLSLGVFLAIAYLSAMQSIDPAASAFWMSNMWKIVVMALLAARLLDTPKKIWTFFLILSFAQGYSAYQINLQYFQTGFSAYAYRKALRFRKRLSKGVDGVLLMAGSFAGKRNPKITSGRSTSFLIVQPMVAP